MTRFPGSDKFSSSLNYTGRRHGNGIHYGLSGYLCTHRTITNKKVYNYVAVDILLNNKKQFRKCFRNKELAEAYLWQTLEDYTQKMDKIFDNYISKQKGDKL